MRLTHFPKLLTYLIFSVAIGLASQPALGDKSKPKPSQTEPTLSMTALNAKGETIETVTKVTGGISVNKSPLQQTATLNMSDAVEIRGTITVDPKHAGKKAELVVYANYKPLTASDSEPPIFYMLSDNGTVQLWDGERTQLATFKTIKKLPKKAQRVIIYKGQLLLPGKLQVFFGYRIKDPGKEFDNLLVTNALPIELIINDTTTGKTTSPMTPSKTLSETPDMVARMPFN